MDVAVLPPDVNRSGAEFTVLEGKICFGLSAIKGCGAAAANALAAERAAHGPYRSIFDFCERLDPGTVNRAAIEALIKAGAFDSLGGNRSQFFAALDRAMQAGAAAANDRRSGQMGLFGGDDDDQPETVRQPSARLAPLGPARAAGQEKEVLGFYLSSHPLAEHEKTLTAYTSHTTVEAAELKHRTEVVLGGMLSAIKYSHTKNPKPGNPSRYAMFDLEDAAGMMRTIVWPDQFVNYEELIKPDAIVVIRGVVDKRPGSEEANLIANEITPLENLAARYTRSVRIRVSEDLHGPHTLEQLHEILRGYPGNCELELTLCLADGSRAACKCDNTRLSVTPEMQARVDQLLGPGNLPPTDQFPRRNKRREKEWAGKTIRLRLSE